MNNHFTVSENISFRQVGNEVFLLHRDNNSVFNLNTTATFIWNSILAGKDVQVIITELCEQFEIDTKTASKDTNELISKLINSKILLPD